MIKIKNHHILNVGMYLICTESMSQSDEGYFFEVDIQYLKKLHNLDNDLPFLRERMTIEKVEKLVANLHGKTEYVIHIRDLKQTYLMLAC